jgi:hypothetical protein
MYISVAYCCSILPLAMERRWVMDGVPCCGYYINFICTELDVKYIYNNVYMQSHQWGTSPAHDHHD